MDQIKYTIHFFLTALGIGTYLFSPIVSTKLTGVGFLKLVLNILIGTLTLSFIIGYFITPFFVTYSYVFYALAILLAIVIIKKHEDIPSKKMIYNRVALSAILLALSYTFHQSLLSFGYFLITMLFLGICNYTMILGHYYLVVPKLTEKPLLISLKIFWILFIIKLGLCAYSIYYHQDFFLSGTTEGFGFIFNWIVISMRVLWGFVALGILSYFGYKLSAMRSIQSATGVFYIMVFFIFVGELIALYTFYETGIML